MFRGLFKCWAVGERGWYLAGRWGSEGKQAARFLEYVRGELPGTTDAMELDPEGERAPGGEGGCGSVWGDREIEQALEWG